MELKMFASTKQVSTAAALVLVLGIFLLAAPLAFASSDVSIVARSASTLQRGDLVRLRSEGDRPVAIGPM
jgi:hypothetical protein